MAANPIQPWPSASQRGVVPIAQRTAYVISTYELAVRRYQPPRLDLEVLLFRAMQNLYGLASNGWHGEQMRALEVLDVTGDHLSIVRTEAGFAPIAQVMMANEVAVSGKSEEDVNAFLDKIANAMLATEFVANKSITASIFLKSSKPLPPIICP